MCAVCASPAQAMNWCALPGLLPSYQSDFETIAARIEPETGCARQPSDSAHTASWKCEDDPQTDQFDGGSILLVREPGSPTSLIVFAVEADLEKIRACNPARYRVTDEFRPGNVLRRGSIAIGGGKSLTLLWGGSDSLNAVYTGGIGDDLAEALGGYRPESSTTRIEVAGKNLISTPVRELLAAIEGRGAKIIETTGDEENGIWELSPMIGLSGVQRIKVQGFLRHTMMVTYSFDSVNSYKAYIPLLDDEYGASSPSKVDSCTVRFWKSLDAAIVGKVCPGKDPVMLLSNRIASNQFLAIAKKIREEPETKRAEPAIDRDNF